MDGPLSAILFLSVTAITQTAVEEGQIAADRRGALRDRLSSKGISVSAHQSPARRAPLSHRGAISVVARLSPACPLSNPDTRLAAATHPLSTSETSPERRASALPTLTRDSTSGEPKRVDRGGGLSNMDPLQLRLGHAGASTPGIDQLPRIVVIGKEQGAEIRP
jgi:hypothetical protein